MSRIKIRKYRIAMPSFNKPSSPIRIAVIGDLHNRVFGEGNSRLADKIIKQYPDMVLSVGDLTVVKPGKEVNLDIGMSLLKRLACDCPVFCIHGNHEYRTKIYPDTYKGVYEQLTKHMRRGGIVLLENERRNLELRGAHITLHGLEIPPKYYKKLSKDYISADEIRHYIGEPEEETYNILLAHNPSYFDSYALWGADLTLSGHLHGGALRLPLIGGVISPQIRLFPKYCCGLYYKYGRRLIVTAGLGSHSFVPRINNPAEVVMLELY